MSRTLLLFTLLLPCAYSINSTTGPITPAPSHPPVPTATLEPLPPRFSNIPQSNLQCWQSHADFSVIRHFLASEWRKSTTRITRTLAPPSLSESTQTYGQPQCTTTPHGLTTLCDGYPRGSSKEVNCVTVPATFTHTYTISFTTQTFIEPTWTSEYARPRPTCKMAEDRSSLCNLMYEAYYWRSSKRVSETPTPTDRAGFDYTLLVEQPFCVQSPTTTSTSTKYTPLCRASASQFSVYYWPTPTPTGSDFCNSKFAAPTATPTIPGTPNTAVVSGLTLTSPSVYHFLKDVKVETYLSQGNTWNVSTTFPAKQPLTVEQLEKDILSASARCSGIEADYCSVYFSNNFVINDISTVRVEAYQKNCWDWRGDCISSDHGTIYQASYSPTLAVAASDLVKQHGILSDCKWNTGDFVDGPWTSRYSSSTGAMVFGNVPRTAFVPITTTQN